MITETVDRTPRACPECRVGALRPTRAFYCAWIDDQFLSVPDFPAQACDVCGRREYDQGALQQLNALLQLKPGSRLRLGQGGQRSGEPVGSPSPPDPGPHG